MSYLRLLSYQSLSNQKQKDSPRRWFGQSLYFNPFAAFGAGSGAKRRAKPFCTLLATYPGMTIDRGQLFASNHD
jgi:hypothetical protein